MIKNATYIVLLILLSSCEYFKKEEADNAIARVNDEYLFKSDLIEKTPKDLKGNDSIAFVQNYINEWAKQQLLLNGAKQNLSDERLEEFDILVEQYKKDLYSNAYLEALVSRNLDTIVKDEVAKIYYTNNSEAFKLNEDLVKLKYITVNKDINSLEQIKTKFRRYNKKDKADLERLKIQFKSYALNDSVWVRSSQVLNKLPVITIDNQNELLKKSNFIELTDSIDLYLVQIKDVLLRGEIAPLKYVRPTINQIVINKRKVDLLKKIETDITKDAIKNKKFEIFN
ncbi:peptidyl-prolyl cis-trans isomerase [Aurantibacter aestuarii]|uniref:peptidyl-prolyl cis-trans isomerase n=1 Tax=Aurantibacter aestuarii TaxID=1266046 RepID=UPI001FEA18D7|nr:peptidyl-prolyl cis-trans isomerase [Aurantibacter aestuarii]